MVVIFAEKSACGKLASSNRAYQNQAWSFHRKKAPEASLLRQQRLSSPKAANFTKKSAFGNSTQQHRTC